MAFALAAALAIALAATGAALHADEPMQVTVLNPESYPLAGGTQPVLDLAASALLPGYAFAQVPDSTPPTFVLSGLDIDTGMTITFSETIDAASIVPARMHVRESGTYTGGVTLTSGELVTVADGATVSFALTPSHLAAVAGLATPELTIEPGAVRDASGNLIVGTFDASTRSFVDATSISEQEDIPTDIAFSSNGTKMFIIGATGDDVNEYDLSAPFDASTRSFVDATSISEQEDIPQGIAFSSDGTKMFVVGRTHGVSEYDLSTPFDASTRMFVDATSISVQVHSPAGIAFSSDGTKMFIVDTSGNDVNEYDLSAPFDASTRSFVDATDLPTRENEPQGMAFSSDGAKMFVIDIIHSDIIEYALSTPFDASTKSFVDATSISAQETFPTGIAFASNGAKMFVIGATGDDVNEYDLHSVYPVTMTRTPPTFVLSVLDIDAGTLAITFSETIDAASIVPARMHVRESGNYTHGVTLTAPELVTVADGATVSFALTPSHLAAVAGLATPELTIEPGAVRDASGNSIVGTFDASTRSFVDATRIRTQEDTPTGMAFSSDGTKMFIIGNAQDNVNEYDLSAPFDASTRSFVDATSISAQETFPTGIAFSSDGAKMFVIGNAGDDVNEYDLSAPFDASTRIFVDATSISAQGDDPQGIAFSSDGAKMFVIGNAGDDVNEYTLSTPFDASTRSFVDATSIRAQEGNPRGMAFSSDGTKMFIIGGTNYVNEYGLSAPFDASTRIFVDATSISAQVGNSQGMAFSSDGTKMFIIDSTGDNVNEYDLHPVYPVTVTRTPPTFVSSELDIDAGTLTITFSETIDAASIVPAKMHVRESGTYTDGVTLTSGELDTAADGATVSFALTPSHLAAVAGLATPELTIEPGAVRDESDSPIVGTFDASTRSFVDATSIQAQENIPQGIAFSSDGTKMFIIGSTGDDVNEYALSTPFDASTRIFVDATSTFAQVDDPQGIAFSNGGTKMFIIDSIGDNVNEYDLFTPFDASTRSFVDATSIATQEAFPTGIAFSSDGTKMFILGTDGVDVNEYALSTPFDASTRIFVDATSILEQENNPRGIAFSSDGTKMLIIGATGDDVNEYDLSAPFDASTRSFVDATSIRAQENIPQGIAFSSDGTKMFIIGSAGDDVNEYELSPVYPIVVKNSLDRAFITTWNVTPSPHTIHISVNVASGGDLHVDWGDGNTGTFTADGIISNTYHDPGRYQVTMTGNLTRINLGNPGSTASNLASIDRWGAIEWSSMVNAFRGASNMTYGATDAPDLSGVTDMSGMFDGASSFNGDISSWDVDIVTDMSGMFSGASSFNGDISSWDVDIVTDMSSMFSGASSFNRPLDSWDVYIVTDMSSMFSGASSFNRPLESWDPAFVTDMSSMFSGASSFNGGISSWDVYIVTDMSSMFSGASSFNGDISSWEVGSVTDMSGMFSGASSFNRPLDSWDVSKVTDMSGMFSGASSFNRPLDSWDVSKVTDMSGMFSGASSFNHPLGTWDVSKVTDMSGMFSGASSFNHPLGTWDVSSVTDMLSMLDNAALFRQNLGEWYVVLDDAVISGATETLDVRAQNSFLDGQSIVYGLGTGGDSGRFIVNAAAKTLGLDPNGVHHDGTYRVIVTSTGGFGTANDHAVAVTVDGIRSAPVPPTFVSSELDIDAGTLTITFSETIDAASIVPARMHVRESGNYTHGVTLTAAELVTVADGATISFALTPSHLAAVAGLATPELTIEPGAVRDESGNPIVGTFDASTRSFVDATSISEQETLPTGIVFSSDGAKMFVIGATGDDVNEYDLSTPFDASTRSFVDATPIRAQETNPQGIAFSNDGAKMFVIGTTGRDVNEYDLSTPFDASTRSFVDATSISGQEIGPRGMAFSSDGAKMFVIGSTGQDVNEYDLSIPFDASTRSFVDATSISEQETFPTGLRTRCSSGWSPVPIWGWRQRRIGWRRQTGWTGRTRLRRLRSGLSRTSWCRRLRMRCLLERSPAPKCRRR